MPKYFVEPVFAPSAWVIEAADLDDAERQGRLMLGQAADDFNLGIAEAR